MQVLLLCQKIYGALWKDSNTQLKSKIAEVQSLSTIDLS